MGMTFDELMNSSKNNDYYHEVGKKSTEEDERSNLGLVTTVIKDMGGPILAVKGSDMLLDFAAKFMPKSKAYQGGISFMRCIVPAAITGYEVVKSVNKYYADDSESDDHDRKLNRIKKLANITNKDEDLPWFSQRISSNIISWILTKPKTDNFNMLGFYNSAFTKVDNVYDDNGVYYAVCEIENKCRFVVEMTVVNDMILADGFWRSTHFLGDAISISMMKSFVESLDCKKNMIVYDKRSIKTVEREKIDFKVYQFDSVIEKEIKRALKKNTKRGYAFIGPPGTGKTTIVQKVIDDIRSVPVVYVSLNDMHYSGELKKAMTFIKSVAPCIAVLEDMDVLDLEGKNDEHLAVLIEEMDGAKCNDCVIFLATMNEPENVHPSLIDRRGRFDKVSFVDYPKEHKEILEVLKNKHKKETGKAFRKKLSKDLLDRMIKIQVNQSDICELVTSLRLGDMEVNEENLNASLDELEKTKNVISQFSDKKD